MRRLHKIAIGCAGLSTLVTSVWANAFTDIAGNPDLEAIEYLQAKNIIGGYPDGTFRPNRTVNRAELLKILAMREGALPAAERDAQCFPDVTSEWFAPYVCYAKKQGWVGGYPDGKFRPADTVNAAEAIKIIMTAIGFHPNQSSASTVPGMDPRVWYATYVDAAIAQHILEDATSFDAAKEMSRAAIAAMVYQSLIHNDTKNARRTTGSTNGGSASIPVITFGDINKNYGDPSFTLSALSNSLGHMTYTSSNPNVISINGSTATIVGVGSATITATQAANGRFAGNTATAALTVNGITPSITFTDLVKSQIDDDFTLSPTSDSPGAFTFTSSNSSIASISGNTVVIPGGLGHGSPVGTVVITASQAASGNYRAATKTMSLTVYATYCVASPCFGGTCTPVLEGALTDDNFSCTCFEGYSGTICDEYSDNCSAPGYCNSGECIADSSGGSCANCAPCLTGDRCQTAIINCEAHAPVLLACTDPMMSRMR